MLRPACCLLVVSLFGCVPDAPDRRGRVNDAGVDASDAGCEQTSFFDDKDGDGHGDANSLIRACAQPANTVTTSDDCDDNNAASHPGASDVCDALDNDCNAATAETCPTGCTAVRRPPPDDQRVYLFCATAQSWTAARTTCTNAGFKLVQIDSAAENTFVRGEATTRFGTGEIHIGASDLVQENTWQWDGSDVFWVGNQNGQPINGKFQAWNGDEPNGTSDCAEMRADLLWYDNDCNDGHRFVCRK